MDDLVVDSHLHTLVVNDEDADAATAVVERLGQAGDETALVKDGKALLDITRLGHGDNAAVLTDVENTVLLEDRTKHVLDNDGRGRVGDEGRLLMELLGEQVNTEVAVLAGLGGGGDADDLARAALEDQEVANADVVAGDGDSLGVGHLADRGTSRSWCGYDGRGVAGRCGCGCGCRCEYRCRCRSEAGSRPGGRCRCKGRCRCVGGRRGVDANDPFNRNSGLDGAAGDDRRSSSGILLLDNHLFAFVVVLGTGVRVLVRVVVAVRVDGVLNAIGDLVCGVRDSLTKRMVLALVVVISHITLVLLGGVDSGTSRLFYSDLGWVARVNNGLGLPLVGVGVRLGSEALLGVTSTGDDGTGAFAELTLGDV